MIASVTPAAFPLAIIAAAPGVKLQSLTFRETIGE